VITQREFRTNSAAVIRSLTAEDTGLVSFSHGFVPTDRRPSCGYEAHGDHDGRVALRRRDAEAATRYGTLVAPVLAANRDPRPRRMDLMIAAIASSRDLPLYTRNEDDFKGLGGMVEIIGI